MTSGASRKKIIFVMVETGIGHRSPAVAVQQALESRFPGKYETAVSDFFREIGALKADREMKRTWTACLRYPVLGWLYSGLSDKTSRLWQFYLRRFYFRKFYAVFDRFIQDREQPVLFFSTHFITSLFLGEYRKRYKKDFRIVTLVTDVLKIHGFWSLPDSDRILVPNRESYDHLRKKGKKNRLKLLPYPVRESFFGSGERPFTLLTSSERKALKEGYGFSDAPLILILTGGEGIGQQYLLTRSFLRSSLKANLLVVNGRNAKMQKKIRRLAEKSERKGRKVISLGYCENLAEIIQMADICVSKPGGASTMELLLLRKPVIFTKAAAPHEKGNIRYAQKMGVGFPMGISPRRFLFWLEALSEEGKLREIRERYERLDLKNGAAPTALWLDHYLKNLEEFSRGFEEELFPDSGLPEARKT